MDGLNNRSSTDGLSNSSCCHCSIQLRNLVFQMHPDRLMDEMLSFWCSSSASYSSNALYVFHGVLINGCAHNVDACLGGWVSGRTGLRLLGFILTWYCLLAWSSLGFPHCITKRQPSSELLHTL